MKCYTLRHKLTTLVEYVIFAESEDKAREIAYQRYVDDEPADDVTVAEDTWNLVEVEDV